MPGSEKSTAHVFPAGTVAGALVALAVLGACAERQPARESLTSVAAGELADACAGDSLRPAAAAPAEGLWLFERPSSRERVAARVGPPRPADGSLVVARPIETVEVTGAGDTLRLRLDTATVSLELLPPIGGATLGTAGADSVGGSQPAATYAPSSGVRLAAYEPCVTSSRGPRIRYLRRDGMGRIVTDVMLQRASDR